jgi:hypothetical protein
MSFASVNQYSGQLQTTSFCSVITNITVQSPEANVMLDDNSLCESHIHGRLYSSHV